MSEETKSEVSTPSEEFVPTLEDKIFLNNKAKEFRMQGASDEDSEKLALEDLKKIKIAEENASDQLWDSVTKKIKLADFLDDQIRRALGAYKAAYLKKYPEFTIDFKLQLKKSGGVGRLIAKANLELSFAVNGNWRVWSNKEINFRHIREINETHKWTLALYEAMFQEIVYWGATYCLHIDAIKSQNLTENGKPEATQ